MMSHASNSLRREISLVLLATICSRLFVWLYRLYNFQSFGDGDEYLLLARWIADSGTFPIHEGFGRLAPGFPLILATLQILQPFGAFVICLVATCSACVLFHLAFRNVHLSLIHVFFLPAWFMNTSTILSEGTAWACGLTGLFLLTHLTMSGLRRYGLCLIFGYSVVVHPLLAVLAFALCFVNFAQRPILSASFESALIALPTIILMLYSTITVGIPFPQRALQEAAFALHAQRSFNFYPATAWSWPGHSLFLGFLDPQNTSMVKMLLNAGHGALAILCGYRLFRSNTFQNEPKLRPVWDCFKIAFAIGIIGILCIGGPFGHTLFYRYLATALNPIIVCGLCYGIRIPAIGILLAACLSMGGALFAGGLGPY